MLSNVIAILLFASTVVSQDNTQNSPPPAQASPAYLSDIPIPQGVVLEYPRDEDIHWGDLPPIPDIDLSGYPVRGELPSTDHPEVQNAMNYVDWTHVPLVAPHQVVDWVVDTSQYDVNEDPYCWWTASICKRPKLEYLPEDIFYCPNAGDWGLNYDDGPFKLLDRGHPDHEWEQPRFYNSLVKNNKQKATLFFVGANVVSFPEAAQRALNDGHTICSHTWSHPYMTSLTNEQVVAQFYWTQKAIKQVLGITPKCWRPPFGDVDDRIRAIAWQMGMRTILWDQDSNDWNMPGTAGLGHITPETVDGFFEAWVDKRVSGNDNEHGHITLQHENSNSTVAMSEKWLPQLQTVFNVIPIHQCINDPSPYWEESFVYPTLDNPFPDQLDLSANNNDQTKQATRDLSDNPNAAVRIGANTEADAVLSAVQETSPSTSDASFLPFYTSFLVCIMIMAITILI
ncbi:hypothetical protein CLU79DRAFT_785724 [Phycomyces nitens]|nr:hypothetical protein CLU79DRAFT_785724 [Phycomyces nitens]